MNCPVCSDTSLVIAERQGIEIDYCPKGRGVWLDRGELDKIIERSSEVLQQSSAPRSDDRKFSDNKKYDDNYYKKLKRKSFFEDPFDF
jgi:Zn-finger nucleic acid-binding protein